MRDSRCTRGLWKTSHNGGGMVLDPSDGATGGVRVESAALTL